MDLQQAETDSQSNIGTSTTAQPQAIMVQQQHPSPTQPQMLMPQYYQYVFFQPGQTPAPTNSVPYLQQAIQQQTEGNQTDSESQVQNQVQQNAAYCTTAGAGPGSGFVTYSYPNSFYPMYLQQQNASAGPIIIGNLPTSTVYNNSQESTYQDPNSNEKERGSEIEPYPWGNSLEQERSLSGINIKAPKPNKKRKLDLKEAKVAGSCDNSKPRKGTDYSEKVSRQPQNKVKKPKVSALLEQKKILMSSKTTKRNSFTLLQKILLFQLVGEAIEMDSGMNNNSHLILRSSIWKPIAAMLKKTQKACKSEFYSGCAKSVINSDSEPSWTEPEIALFKVLLERFGYSNISSIAQTIPGRTVQACEAYLKSIPEKDLQEQAETGIWKKLKSRPKIVDVKSSVSGKAHGRSTFKSKQNSGPKKDTVKQCASTLMQSDQNTIKTTLTESTGTRVAENYENLNSKQNQQTENEFISLFNSTCDNQGDEQSVQRLDDNEESTIFISPRRTRRNRKKTVTTLVLKDDNEFIEPQDQICADLDNTVAFCSTDASEPTSQDKPCAKIVEIEKPKTTTEQGATIWKQVFSGVMRWITRSSSK